MNKMEKLFTSVTNEESVVLKKWSTELGDNFCTGVKLSACAVFAICDGVVVQILKSDKYRSVITLRSYDGIYFRYCGMDTRYVAVIESQEVVKGQKLGQCYNNCLLFELCTEEKSKFPVRVWSTTVFKHDPLPYLAGDDIINSNRSKYTETNPADLPEVTLSSSMISEFSDSRGDDE